MRPLSLDHLLQRGPQILDDVAGWLAAPTARVFVDDGTLLDRASLEGLWATLSFLSPVLDAPLPQRMGRLCDVLTFSSDAGLVALAESWAQEMRARDEVWVASLRRPEVMPTDWPHRPLLGSNPRFASGAPVLGVDDGKTCQLLDLSGERGPVTLPGRLLTLAADGSAALAQERSVLRCWDGEQLRWEQPKTPLLTQAVFQGEQVIALGSRHLFVFDARTGRELAHHERDGMRGLLVCGAQVALVAERSLHSLDPALTARFTVQTTIAAAAAAHDRAMFVSEYWKRVVCIDPQDWVERWSRPVRAQNAALAVSADGTRVAVGSAKSTDPLASIFDTRDGGSRLDVGQRGTTTEVVFDGSGARLIAGSSVFDVASGARLGVLAGRGGLLTGAQISGSHLVGRSPGGLCLLEGRGELHPQDEARPALRALLFEDQLLTDGAETGFERFTYDGRLLEQRAETLVGVLGMRVLVTSARDGETRLAVREDGAWRTLFGDASGARPSIWPGLDALVLEHLDPPRFEVRESDGALRFAGPGQVRCALDGGRWLVVDDAERCRVLDARAGAERLSLGAGVRRLASDGDRIVALREVGESRTLELHQKDEQWRVALTLPRLPDQMSIDADEVLLAWSDLDPGTELANREARSFDLRSGASLRSESTVEPSGPGSKSSRLGPLTTEAFAGSTSVFFRGTPIAALPSLLEWVQGPQEPLLIGPRGPSIYAVRGRLRAYSS